MTSWMKTYLNVHPNDRLPGIRTIRHDKLMMELKVSILALARAIKIGSSEWMFAHQNSKRV